MEKVVVDYKRPIKRLVTFFLVLIIVVSVGNIYLSSHSANQESKLYMNLLCQKEGERLNNELAKVEQTVLIMAYNISESVKDTDILADEEYRNHLKEEWFPLVEVTCNNIEAIQGMYVRFNPELSDPNAGFYVKKGDGSQRVYEMATTNLYAYDRSDISNVGWYYETVEHGQATWLGPYKEASSDKQVLSYVIPMYRNYTLIGIVGMDISFEYYLNELKQSVEIEQGFMYLLDGEGNVIYHPTQNKGESLVKDKNYVYDEYVVDNGMSVGVAAPYKVVYRERINVINNSILLLIAGIGIIGTLGLISLKGIGKKEETMERTLSELNSVASIYKAMYVINKENDTFYPIISTSSIESYLKLLMNDSARENLNSIIEAMVDETQKAQMLDFVNFDNIEVRMIGKASLSAEFECLTIGWCRARIIRMAEHPNEYIMAIETIGEEKRKESHLVYLSETDQMTGIRNRSGGEKAIIEHIEKRHVGLLVLLDVDNFKAFNDTYGHAIGDKVLIAVADCLKRAFRESDVVLRLGGDEFAAYAVGIEDRRIATQIIKRAFNFIDKIQIEEIGERKITVSLGATFYDGSPDLTFDGIYKQADAATYVSKGDKSMSTYTYYTAKMRK